MPWPRPFHRTVEAHVISSTSRKQPLYIHPNTSAFVSMVPKIPGTTFPVQRDAIKRLDGCLGFALVTHLDEPVSRGVTLCPSHDSSRQDRAKRQEKLAQLV